VSYQPRFTISSDLLNLVEGNPLTLAQVRALEEGRELAASDERSEREVTNYFADLRYVVSDFHEKVCQNLIEIHFAIGRGPGFFLVEV